MDELQGPGIVLTVIAIAYSVILHEIAHGYSAKLFGDPTADRLGRVSLNPIDHIDPIGTILFPLAQIIPAPHRVYLAWAKPVPVNPNNLEPRVAGEIVVSMAGIFVNLCIALALAIVLGFPKLAPYQSQLRLAITYTLQANVGLAIFNLIPVPPLDGHHVVKHLLPANLRGPYERLGFQGMMILLVLNFTGVLTPIIAPPFFWIVEALRDHVTYPILRMR